MSVPPSNTPGPAGTNSSRTVDQPVRIALVGAGNRGQNYLKWVHTNPNRARLVAVADPRADRREIVAAGDPSVVHYDDWRDLARAGKVADMVIISTQDRDHMEPTEAFADLGYAILLEKPIAPSEDECRQIIEIIRERDVMFGVCHVLRYTPYTDLVKKVVDSGVLGEIIDIEHLEPVGWWHMAHSYVRGPWRRESESAPMLLAKSCHDLDWIRYVTGMRIDKVASFGSLKHFRPENRPEKAADRCLDCVLEPDCPYSASKLYLKTFHESGAIWPVSVITARTDEEGVIEALREGPFGRCVYACDNDVVDHQVVAFSFEGGSTGTFTMTAFSEQTHRKTRIFGTHGRLEGDGESVNVLDFRDNSEYSEHCGIVGGSNAADDHGGGDGGLMDAFTMAVSTGDAAWIRSGAIESLESHLTVFAAEEARHRAEVRSVSTL